MLIVKSDIDGKGKRLVTTQPIKKDEVVYFLKNYEVITSPTYSSIQISQTLSIEELTHIVYLNHSCVPNVIIDTMTMEIRATRDIAADEDLNFFYPSTEWDMSSPFACLCGSDNCLGIIAGAKHLSLNVLSQYFINHHIGIMALECLTRLNRSEPEQLLAKQVTQSLLH